MTTINLVRYSRELPPEEDLQKIRGFLFGLLDGHTEEDKKAWRKFWRRIMRLEFGEMARIDAVIPRNYKFHKKFFALLQVGFDAWVPPRKRKTYKGMPVAKNFDRFRKDIIIQAGFYDQTFDLDGRMCLEAQSISFGSMDDDEFEKVYSAVADALLERVLTAYNGREELDAVIGKLEGFL